MARNQALYSSAYSRSAGVRSLMTEPSERSGLRMGRVSTPFRAASRNRWE
jgi:hypothetical protein